MRLHTDHLTAGDIHKAVADLPGVYADVTTHGSRKRARGLEMKLTGTSSRRPNGGTRGGYGGDDYAATWDEWGIVFDRLFDLDPDMTCYAYDDADDFHYKTGTRFVYLTIAYQHPNHKWEYVAPGVHECDCGATRRF